VHKPVTNSRKAVTLVARDEWPAVFAAQGQSNRGSRMSMLDGFNQDWIRFAGPARKGVVTFKAVLKDLPAANG